MANYYCKIRTNYFHVTDEDGFKEFMKTVRANEDSIELWGDEKDNDGNTLFGFGCESCINGVRNSDDEEADCDYDAFIEGLQRFVDPADAVIIFEVGSEKLRYLVGVAIIVTKTEVLTINMDTVAVEAAAKMLNNENWSTQCDY